MAEWSEKKKWLMGIVAALTVSAIVGAWSLIFKTHPDSDLKIVDIKAIQNWFDLSTVDVKFRNPAPSPAYIKNIELVINNAQYLETCSLCPGAPVEASASYDLDLSNGKSQKKDVSFVVKSQSVDRFELKIHHLYSLYPSEKEFSVYEAQLKITYDEDSKVITSSKFYLPFGNYDWAISDLTNKSFEDWDQDETPDVYFSCNKDVQSCVTKNQSNLEKMGYKYISAEMIGPSR